MIARVTACNCLGRDALFSPFREIRWYLLDAYIPPDLEAACIYIPPVPLAGASGTQFVPRRGPSPPTPGEG